MYAGLLTLILSHTYIKTVYINESAFVYLFLKVKSPMFSVNVYVYMFL